MEKTAVKILQRGVDLDHKHRYTEALVCYQEGLQILVDSLKDAVVEKREYLRNQIELYMGRAEKIKKDVVILKEQGKFHELITIENDATGYSYNSVFGRFLDEDVTTVTIEDPYIKAFHQCQNLVKFIELLMKKCPKLGNIKLVTTRDNETVDQQKKCFNGVKNELTRFQVAFHVSYSPTLHDRQITLSSGWIIKIGRGLDYFKAPENKFALGMFDMDFRKCYQTQIDIFHSNYVRQS